MNNITKIVLAVIAAVVIYFVLVKGPEQTNSTQISLQEASDRIITDSADTTTTSSSTSGSRTQGTSTRGSSTTGTRTTSSTSSRTSGTGTNPRRVSRQYYPLQ